MVLNILPMAKDACVVCSVEIGMGNRWSCKPEWGFPPDSKMCTEHYNERNKQAAVEKTAEKLTKYDGSHIKVVEIPIVFAKIAWDKVEELSGQGYMIKAILEREITHTSLVVMEKH